MIFLCPNNGIIIIWLPVLFFVFCFFCFCFFVSTDADACVTESTGTVKVEVAVLGSPSLIVLKVSVDVYIATLN